MPQPAKSAGFNSDINVTPFVDVVLVLLIIFMVVTPMLQKGPPVRLPVTASPPKKPEDKNQILVALEHDKNIWIEKERMTEADFQARIAEWFQRNPGSDVVIKADSRLTYGEVKRTMLKVKEAGFRQVGLIVDKRQK